MEIEIQLDSHLRIFGLNPDWNTGLARLVSVANEAKEVALKEKVWGAKKMDDLLTLASIEKDTLILPRGFKDELEELLRDNGYSWSYTDKTVWSKNPSEDCGCGNRKPKLSEEQSIATAKLIEWEQGRIIAPPGTGKTVVGLYAIAALQVPTLIIVEKKHVAQQWVDRAKEHFGLDIGFIGDDRWNQRKVTVALIQTLNSREDELDIHFSADQHWETFTWWDGWSMVILDEQHHIPAETFTNIVSKFRAKKRFGLSATIGKTPAKKRISELMFGPILYESAEVEVKPEIVAVETNFDYVYWPTHKAEGKVIRNNYKQMIKALISDQKRNALIAHYVMQNKDHCNLIVSDRLDQLAAIRYLCEGSWDMQVYSLTGNESLSERMSIYELANEGHCAIFSTVADEALDIPRIDRVHMAYPRKNEEAIWQIIGRGIREHPDKESCIIYDYVDKVDVLYAQYTHRLRTLYQRKQLTVTKITSA